MLTGQQNSILPDEWSSLKKITQARIALGRTGVSLPLSASLDLKLAHANARDAVYSSIHTDVLCDGITAMGMKYLLTESQAVDRTVYLQRPDLGRKLSVEGEKLLSRAAGFPKDICLIIGDGLSADAVNQNSLLVIEAFTRRMSQLGYSFTPIIIAQQARVALADEIAHTLKARMSVILIGERPGLSASDSLGAYLTYDPRPGNTDEKRNCISNIRENGLKPVLGAEKLAILAHRSFLMAGSGLSLKEGDDMGDALIKEKIY